MATRSRIGIQTESGEVKSIYCHWDGYPEHNGKILVNHYTDRAKVEALIELGDISLLDKSVECPKGHSFENAVDGHTVAYGRDRGETGVEARSDRSADSFFSSDIEEFGYLFTKEGEWKMVSYGDRNPVLVESKIGV